MANSYLNRTPSVAGNRRTFTFSCWVKRSRLSYDQGTLLSAAQSQTGDRATTDVRFGFNSSDELSFDVAGFGNLNSVAKFRDTSAWYHVVLAVDTTQGTASDRYKLYVNNILQSTTGGLTINQNDEYAINNNVIQYIGFFYRSSYYFEGYMTHVHFIDGTQYAASDFGQTNSTTGIWGPKVSPSVTYGTNGFFLKFENSGTLGTDSSGNGNNFSVSGSLLQGKSTPTNLFNTINYVDCSANASQIKVSATQLYATGGGDIATRGTLGVNSGKWYWECKSIISAGHGNRKMVGFYDGISPVGNGRALSSYRGVLVDLQTGTVYKNGSTSGTTNISSFSSGDIVGVFFDADNGEMRFSKNGNMENSGNAVATGVDMSNYLYVPYISQDGGGTNNGDMNCNFGEGYFATTAVSSGNADANGYGQFEYNPVVSSTNYYALCTKNMEQY
jgi:hypothetical protein